jgi:protein-S-isoprenylcysteine O-methyltransferase Ste14
MWRVTPVLVALMLAILMNISLSVLDHGVWQLHHTVGAAVIVPAFALWACARYQLGASFTARAEARSLVTNGLYSRIRHPIYLTAEMLIAGLSIFIGYPVLWLVSLALLPWQVKRARREERALQAAFGERYETYRSGTWF